ncbi:hypothetical protein [Rhodanobacter sp. FW106-PBR-LB-2-11]|uniref:hypothetical protein n=1 Tax=Rhodanobacter sp. FW106-PBR-LB-2-11 TaxID=1524463 RepID=UPI0007A99499|nr:hypothetical protein RhoFW510R10_11865 [Rhodanobacter sp. FW510-R10]
MRLESAFVINLRIGIAVLAGACAGLLARLLMDRDVQASLSIGSLVTAGVLLASYFLVPARSDG